MKHKIGLLVLLAAYVLLIPGLTKPMITLTGTVDKAELAQLGKQMIVTNDSIPRTIGRMAANLIDQFNVEGRLPAYEKTRSITGTVKELFDAQSYLVGFLIMLFSIIIPVTKGLLILLSHFQQEGRLKFLGQSVSNLISKWSMADVFVVAIIVAFLAANATEKTEELFSLNATFGEGFWFFLAYCLLSILSVQLMPRSLPAKS